MIAFKNNRPVIQVGAGFITDYGFAWLADAFEEAAQKAGMTLPFKNDLIASVIHYLEQSCDLDVLPIDTLYEKIRTMLCGVGLDLLAEFLPTTPPPYPVSIGTIAQKNPLPLFFFNELDHELAELHDLGLTNYEFTDVKQCVLTLQGHKKWTKSSEKMLAYLEFVLQRYQDEAA